jgi:fibronectin-binding autotransporter adhesin
MKINRPVLRFYLSLPLALALGGTQANAADRTWGNTGTDFATGANWVGGTAPANDTTSDRGLFTAATAANNPEFTADRSINSLQFDSGTAAWTFTGSGGPRTLTLGGGGFLGIRNDSTNTQTFSASLQLALAGTTTITAQVGAININGNIDNGGHTIQLRGTVASSISGVISGTGGLTKFGTQTYTLSGDNTFTGVTTMQSGALLLAHPNALAGSSLNMNNAGGIYFGSLTTANFGYLYGGATAAVITLTNDSAGPVALTVGSNSQESGGYYQGVLSGLGSLTKVGTSDLGLEGNNTYSGGTTINEGTVTMYSETALGSGTVTFASDGTVVAGAFGAMVVANNFILDGGAEGTIGVYSDSLTNSGVISGAGDLTKAGPGMMILGATNTYTGTTTINEGVLAVTNGAAIADTGAVTLADAAGATFTVQNSETIGSLRGGGATGGDVTIASGQTLTVAETGSQTFAGIISDAGGLTKTGVGTLTLTGTNTYTGATTVSAGQLLVNGSSSDSAHTVGNGGTLGGTGTVGALVVQSDGTISPGNSPGILSSGSTTWENGGNYNWQVLDATGGAGTGWDQLAITGALDLAGLTPGGFNVNVWSLSTFAGTTGDALNFNGSLSYSWPIATTTTGITGFDAGDFTIFTASNNGTNGFTNSFPGGFSMSVSGNNLNLNYDPTPVPEPASAFTVLALFSGAVLQRRKRVVRH